MHGLGSGFGLLAGAAALCVLTTLELSGPGPYSILAEAPDHGYEIPHIPIYPQGTSTPSRGNYWRL